MAKPLIFIYQGEQLTFEMSKVDRTRLYGFIEKEARDEQERVCQMARLAGDGHTIFGSGSLTLGSLSPDGLWRESGSLKAVDSEGKVITPVPSTFSAPVPLDTTASLEDYLSCAIRSVYLLTGTAGEMEALHAELSAGKIYRFPFSYRGGLEADDGFLLAGADGSLWLALGTKTQLEFVGLDDAVPDAVEEESEEEEEMDFSMM